MTYMNTIKEFVRDICREALWDLDRADPIEDYQLEEWLDNNTKFRELKDYVTGANVEFDMDMRVKDLRAILSRIDDEDMNVIIPVLDTQDDKYIHGFRHVRAAGILANQYEPTDALCLSAPGGGLDMYSQLEYNSFEATTCKQGLF